jgi:rhodanese-related sulfurtransferase
MGFSPEDVEANRRFFTDKLRAYRQLTDLIHKVKHDPVEVGDFILLDVRSRGAYRKAHVPGALCVPYEELATLAAALPRDRELVTFCWSHF